MSVEQMLRDYDIPHMTEGHQHCTYGWVNVHCPFCTGSQNYHMGIHEELTAVHCWRCGKHKLTLTISTLLGLSIPETLNVIERYRVGARKTPEKEPQVSIHQFRYPTPYHKLNEQGQDYLLSRGFDPDKIMLEWGVLQTGPACLLDGTFYQHRLLIPIVWDDHVVSFQTRTIRKKKGPGLKYLACPMKREKIHHKNILYGKQDYWRRSPAILVVEGVTDVWRLGPAAAATFGTSFKTEQVLQLAKHNDRFFAIFDNEPQAQEQARKLVVKLQALGKEAEIVRVENDPGSMSQDEADKLVNKLIGGI